MAGSKFLKGLAAQFGVSLDEAPPPNVSDGLTPEQRRRAEIELEATTRGKVVLTRAEAAAPSKEPAAPAAQPGAPIDENGDVNFAALYAQAGVPPAKFTAEQALDIIKDCDPSEAARRQTIKVIATFGKNVGATPDEIIVDATDKQDALHDFMAARDDDLIAFNSKAEEQIASLLARVDQLKQMKQDAARQHDAVQASCQEELSRMEQVRDFFRQEISASS